MSETANWHYDDKRHTYTCHVGHCTIDVRRDSDGQWSTVIESGRRHALHTGFVSLTEGQSWGIEQAELMTVTDRRQSERND